MIQKWFRSEEVQRWLQYTCMVEGFYVELHTKMDIGTGNFITETKYTLLMRLPKVGIIE
jgi:hypothetical protein